MGSDHPEPPGAAGTPGTPGAPGAPGEPEEPLVLEAEPVPPPRDAAPGPGTRGRGDASWNARLRIAWLVAIAADALQIVIVPFFAMGAVSPVVDVLDFVVLVVLWRLLGFHVALLPSFVAELIPLVDLVPTWTAAVWFIQQGRKAR
jgi:hypothetical protein